MSFRLFPKAPKFFQFFREQNRIIVEAATVLNTIVLDYRDCDVRCQMINRLEADGDAQTGQARPDAGRPGIDLADRRTGGTVATAALREPVAYRCERRRFVQLVFPPSNTPRTARASCSIV